jgi:uncharacterized protein (DUF924 family)
MRENVDDIHAFWFGELDESGMCSADRHALWFTSSPQNDAHCRDRFGLQVRQAIDGSLDSWAEHNNGLVALIILLDQFTRNIYRNTPQAFAGDGKALTLAQHTIASGHHQRLPAIHQVFLYMPLEHTEDAEVQDECVTLFEQLAAVTGSARIANFTRYAVAHRDVIAQFGRFPHRNAILGRESTPPELAYLERHGGF